MTEYTWPATWEDLKTVVGCLRDAGVEYALVGGYAIATLGFNRFSEDIDILVNPSVDNSRRRILALSRLPDGAARELSASPDVFAQNQLYAIRVNDEFTVYVVPAINGLTWGSMQPHIITMTIDDMAVRILNLPGLLKTKQGLRPKDQMDAAVIAAAIEAADHKT